jgi:hypothetical protein
MHKSALAVAVVLGFCSGCSNSSESDPQGATGDFWTPSVRHAAPTAPRDLVDVRGLIHAHSVYSHDACDGEPRAGEDELGAINEECFDDFRRDICNVKHDYVMLTDHDTSFTHTPFPDVLLYRADRGDELVERAGAPMANRMSCPDGRKILVMAGTESNTMPVGLEGHVGATPEERDAIYNSLEPKDLALLKDAGAVLLVAHTEDWTPEQLVDLPLDGFEMYNLHANLMGNIGKAAVLITQLDNPEELPHADLTLMPLLEEDPIYLERWGTVLARGARRVTTMGTDCHRNSLPTKLPDGERIDSYRRMMLWFSNHLLIQPNTDGSWDDVDLKEALKAGRLYGVFEMFGYPEGFDFHAMASGAIHDVGAEVSAADSPQLMVALPTIRDLDPSASKPEITLRLLKAKEGGWSVVAEGTSALAETVTEPGAYRAEVRIRPRHLTGYLGAHTDLAEESFPFIYSNAIYVTK